MAKKIANPNARQALNQMKLEISNELGMQGIENKSSNSSYENGAVGGKIGGRMSKRLVEMGQEILLQNYNNNNQ
ncbi:MAG: small, acid-soluble spore protein, alpha/beta type [Peptostreptococcaceae bacterium]